MLRHVNVRSLPTLITLTRSSFSRSLRWTSTLVQPKESILEPPVLTKSLLASRQFILNRPKRLNALNLDMIKIMLPTLKTWEESDLAKVVILKGEGKALCAGGDVRDVVSFASNNDPRLYEVMDKEYQLLHTIANLTTPYVALMDGFTMGAGAALCMHGGFKVATENTLFAMPETAIGIFPDVGSSFFLTRLDGQLGTYLAMTGNTIKGEDVLFAGLATHFVPSSRLNALETRLAELDSAEPDHIDAAIEEFAATDDQNLQYSLAGSKRETIERCFNFDTVEEILAALEKDGSDFALQTKSVMLKRAPTALKITLEQMRTGANLDIAQCLKMEHKLLHKIATHHDFREGVSAHLVSKKQPQWKPNNLSEVDLSHIKSEYFHGPCQRQLELLPARDYKHHPYRKYALPSEEDIRYVVTNQSRLLPPTMTRQTVVDYFVAARKGKFGVRQKVLEVLRRKTRTATVANTMKLEWIY
ncbi:hypothetical protein EC973_000297 [Apophysomyces ossiformis]|uniref:3-hydroxyisobutyryl-CoA hydrolase n=1 Tax=Apophysomyces ossiformis TaxID=679940 RepID=A0A8H7EN80_9FUNG|nr:hypothetical protein EC973_000297 [Apophysomyces ossiformis]